MTATAIIRDGAAVPDHLEWFPARFARSRHLGRWAANDLEPKLVARAFVRSG